MPPRRVRRNAIHLDSDHLQKIHLIESLAWLSSHSPQCVLEDISSMLDGFNRNEESERDDEISTSLSSISETVDAEDLERQFGRSDGEMNLDLDDVEGADIVAEFTIDTSDISFTALPPPQERKRGRREIGETRKRFSLPDIIGSNSTIVVENMEPAITIREFSIGGGRMSPYSSASSSDNREIDDRLGFSDQIYSAGNSIKVYSSESFENKNNDRSSSDYIPTEWNTSEQHLPPLHTLEQAQLNITNNMDDPSYQQPIKKSTLETSTGVHSIVHKEKSLISRRPSLLHGNLIDRNNASNSYTRRNSINIPQSEKLAFDPLPSSALTTQVTPNRRNRANIVTSNRNKHGPDDTDSLYDMVESEWNKPKYSGECNSSSVVHQKKKHSRRDSTIAPFNLQMISAHTNNAGFAMNINTLSSQNNQLSISGKGAHQVTPQYSEPILSTTPSIIQNTTLSSRENLSFCGGSETDEPKEECEDSHFIRIATEGSNDKSSTAVSDKIVERSGVNCILEDSNKISPLVSKMTDDNEEPMSSNSMAALLHQRAHPHKVVTSSGDEEVFTPLVNENTATKSLISITRPPSKRSLRKSASMDTSLTSSCINLHSSSLLAQFLGSLSMKNKTFNRSSSMPNPSSHLPAQQQQPLLINKSSSTRAIVTMRELLPIPAEKRVSRRGAMSSVTEANADTQSIASNSNFSVGTLSLSFGKTKRRCAMSLGSLKEWNAIQQRGDYKIRTSTYSRLLRETARRNPTTGKGLKSQNSNRSLISESSNRQKDHHMSDFAYANQAIKNSMPSGNSFESLTDESLHFMHPNQNESRPALQDIILNSRTDHHPQDCQEQAQGSGGGHRGLLHPSMSVKSLVLNSRDANYHPFRSACSQKFHKPAHSRRSSALLFVDISGFTKLSTMVKVEALSEAINTYFELIVNEVTSHRGDILKFAGDALFAEWRVTPISTTIGLMDQMRNVCGFAGKKNITETLEDCAVAAAMCGANIVDMCSDWKVRGYDALLNVHCGLGVGELVSLHVEDESGTRRELLILGDPIDQVSEAEGCASSGELVASREVLEFLSKRCILPESILTSNAPSVIACRAKCEFEVRRVGRKHRQSSIGTVGSNSDYLETESSDTYGEIESSMLEQMRQQLALYVHPVVSGDEFAKGEQGNNMIVQGKSRKRILRKLREEAEIRSVLVMFIKPNIEARLRSDKEDDELFTKLRKIMRIVCREIDRYNGQLRQYIVDDKGVVLIATFGLRYSVFPNMISGRALPSAFGIRSALRTELSIDCNIGATFGEAYCGVVGGILRHEYAVLGPSVNLAARLMASPQNKGIMVDESVKKHAQSGYLFQRLPAVKAKGYAEPVPTYVPLGPIIFDDMGINIESTDHSTGPSRDDCTNYSGSASYTSSNGDIIEELCLQTIDLLDILARKVVQSCAILGHQFRLSDVIRVHPEFDSSDTLEYVLETISNEGIIFEVFNNESLDTFGMDDRRYQFTHDIWRKSLLKTMLAERKKDLTVRILC